MRAVATYGDGKVEIVHLPEPEITDYECLIQMKACGVCNSTDLKIIKNKIGFRNMEYPVILGHEHAGEVIRVGNKVKHINIGERYINPLTRLLPDSPFTRAYGGTMEYGIVQDRKAMYEAGLASSPEPVGACRQIPNNISFEEAGVIHALKETYSCLRAFGFQAGMEALIYGDGPVGLSIAKFMKLEGAAYVACAGHHDNRLDRLKEVANVDLTINSLKTDLKDALGEKKFDLVVDAVGNSQTIRSGLPFLKPGAKLGIYGVPDKDDGRFNLFDLPNHVCLHVLMQPYKEQDFHDKIISMIRKGEINPKDYYSHVIPFEQYDKAIEMTANRSAYKVIITF